LVGFGRRRLELLGDRGHVARVLQELLEDRPLTLTDGAAERRRLLIGHVELRHRRGCQRLGDLARRRVGVDAQRHLLVECAGAGVLPVATSTLSTDVAKSVCSAPDVPPAMLLLSPITCAIVFRAAITDGSVHLIVWAVSSSYLAGPAWRR